MDPQLSNPGEETGSGGLGWMWPGAPTNTDGWDTGDSVPCQSQKSKHMTHLSTASQLPETVLKYLVLADLTAECDLVN